MNQAGLRIALTHLSPADAAARLVEARELAARAAREPRRPFVLLGDPTTLARINIRSVPDLTAGE